VTPLAKVAPPVAAPSTPTAPSRLGAYAFGGIGLMRDGGQLAPPGPAYSQSKLGMQLGAGFQFTPMLGAELAYQTAKAFDPPGAASVKARVLAARLTVGGDVSTGLRAFGKLGMARATHSVGGVSDSQTRPTIGLGMVYNLDDNWGVRFDYDRLLTKSSNSGSSWKSNDYLGIGAQYNF
jgi:predicted porin